VTAEQAHKHNTVIKWFCDNPEKGVWFDHSDGWRLIYEPLWATAATYLPNDEYIKFRIALVDGETIQYLDESVHPKWHDTHPVLFCMLVERYRIKPTKPEFSIGDWITHYNGFTYRVCESQFTIITDNNTWGDHTLWEPIINEYVCYAVNETEYVVLPYTPSEWLTKFVETTKFYPPEFIATLKD